MQLGKLPPGVFMQLANRHTMRAWLDYRAMSYADLGSLVGVSKQFIHKLASGEKTTCSTDVAKKIEMVLLPPPSERRPTDLPLFVPRGSADLCRNGHDLNVVGTYAGRGRGRCRECARASRLRYNGRLATPNGSNLGVKSDRKRRSLAVTSAK